jgi:hypothetical protein
MNAHRVRRGQNKKSPGKKKSALRKEELTSRVRRQIDHRWPNLGRQLASLIHLSREKLDDLYSSAAEAINEHKEAFEDRRAERKAQTLAEARAARQSEFKALPTPPEVKVRESGKKAAANGTFLPSAGKNQLDPQRRRVPELNTP